MDESNTDGKQSTEDKKPDEDKKLQPLVAAPSNPTRSNENEISATQFKSAFVGFKRTACGKGFTSLYGITAVFVAISILLIIIIAIWAASVGLANINLTDGSHFQYMTWAVCLSCFITSVLYGFSAYLCRMNYTSDFEKSSK